MNEVLLSQMTVIAASIALGAYGLRWCQCRQDAKRAMGYWPHRFDQMKVKERV